MAIPEITFKRLFVSSPFAFVGIAEHVFATNHFGIGRDFRSTMSSDAAGATGASTAEGTAAGASTSDDSDEEAAALNTPNTPRRTAALDARLHINSLQYGAAETEWETSVVSDGETVVTYHGDEQFVSIYVPSLINR